MKAWMLIVQRRDDTSWLSRYMRSVPKMIKEFGGTYVAVSRKVSAIETALTGTDHPAPELIAVIGFPSRERIEAFMNSEAYKPFADERRASSMSDIYILDELQTEFPF